jgi:hypothetical protein
LIIIGFLAGGGGKTVKLFLEMLNQLLSFNFGTDGQVGLVVGHLDGLGCRDISNVISWRGGGVSISPEPGWSIGTQNS